MEIIWLTVLTFCGILVVIGGQACEERIAGFDYIDGINSLGGSWLPEPWENYANEFYHCWLIKSELGGKIQLFFDVFQLQAKQNGVCLDWVKVYDGEQADDNKLLGTFCGPQNGTTLKSTEHEVLVIFSTDSSITDIGFNIHFHTFDIDYNPGGSPSNIGLIIGVVLGVMIALGGIITAVVLCIRCKKSKRKLHAQQIQKTAIPYSGDNVYPSVVVGPLPEKK